LSDRRCSLLTLSLLACSLHARLPTSISGSHSNCCFGLALLLKQLRDMGSEFQGHIVHITPLLVVDQSICYSENQISMHITNAVSELILQMSTYGAQIHPLINNRIIVSPRCYWSSKENQV
jgi:hypothetical protein